MILFKILQVHMWAKQNLDRVIIPVQKDKLGLSSIDHGQKSPRYKLELKVWTDGKLSKE